MRSSHNSKSSNSALQEAEREGLLPDRPSLTKKQIEFLHVFAASPFMSVQEICRQVKIQPGQVARWKKNSKEFNKALDREHSRSQQVVNMSREVVMRGLLEAIEIAKDLRQPGGMITGWKEVGRMCGYYEPEKREIRLSVSGQELIEEMKSLPREKLLEYASQKKAFEAEFEVIDRE